MGYTKWKAKIIGSAKPAGLTLWINRQKVDALVRRVFGASTEALDPTQLELLLQLAPATATPTTEPPQRLPEPRGVSFPQRERAPAA